MKATARAGWVLAAAVTTQAACSSTDRGAVSLYTSVTQETVEAVVEGYRAENPDVEVEVFRAPTGELNARLAVERREGGIRADVLWLTDPLSIQQYDADGLLEGFDPVNADRVPAEYRADRFWEGDAPGRSRWALLVRPEWARLGGDLDGVVEGVWYRGPHTDYRLDAPGGAVEIRHSGPARALTGDRVGWSLERAWVLGGGKRQPPHPDGDPGGAGSGRNPRPQDGPGDPGGNP